jgi:hypothetical protein
MSCAVCGLPLEQERVAGAVHAGCFAASVPGDLLALFTSVAAMVLAPMIVVWGG